MKLSSALVVATTHLLSVRASNPPGRFNTSCTFSITSAGPFACPAGRLEDGQIRLNGSYPTADFQIANGGIVDSAGFGCILTEPPTTQFQCDMNKAPDPNFAVWPNNVLMYKDSAKFYACPATDTEWNVYVNPAFGQTKCVPINLVASGCGECAPAPPATVWQTQTVTQAVTRLSTVTVTTVAGANGTVSTKSCHRCTKTPKGPSSSLLSRI